MRSFIGKVLSAITAICAAAAISLTASAETFGFGVQTTGYFFRSNVAQSRFIVWDTEQYKATKTPLSDFSPEAYYADSVKFVDADVTSDGTYTVSFSGIPQSNMSGSLKATAFNWLLLTSNLDSEKYPDVKITINSLTVGGKTVLTNTVLTKSGNQKYLIADLIKSSYWDNSGFTSTIKNTLRVQFLNCYDKGNSLVKGEIPYAENAVCVFTVEGFKSPSGENVKPENSKDENSSSVTSEDEASKVDSSDEESSVTENVTSSETSTDDSNITSSDETISSDETTESSSEVTSSDEISTDESDTDEDSSYDTDTSDDSVSDDKDNAETGAEGIAFASGIGILALVAVMLTRIKE